MAKWEKKAKIAAIPEPKKIPRWDRDPRITAGRHLSWRFSHVDRDGPFSWAALADNRTYREAVEKLHEFETRNWNDITRAGSHPIKIDRLCKEAQERLAELELDDIDELMSFRLTGANRIWCHQHDDIMRVLWWDPEHKVYPTPVDKADRAKLKNRR